MAELADNNLADPNSKTVQGGIVPLSLRGLVYKETGGPYWWGNGTQKLF